MVANLPSLFSCDFLWARLEKVGKMEIRFNTIIPPLKQSCATVISKNDGTKAEQQCAGWWIDFLDGLMKNTDLLNEHERG
jgi:hypothetical protein